MFDALKARLHGCFYTIFTPFTAGDEVDYDALGFYLTALYRQGARRFYAMAYNSRYSQMSPAEIMDLNGFCIRLLKQLDPENIVVVGDPIHCSTRVSTEFARHAREEGGDLVSLIVREKYFYDEQILDHFAAVGRDSRMAILVHEMPFLSGANGVQMHWPESLLLALPKVEHIVALKEDAKDFAITCKALELEPRIRVVIAGIKKKFMAFKPYGARAYLNGISIIDARIGEQFWQAYETGDQAFIDFVIEKLEAPFFDRCAGRFGWHRVNKALLQAAGYMHRRDRMPLPHLDDEDFKVVEAVYAEVAAAWQAHLAGQA